MWVMNAAFTCSLLSFFLAPWLCSGGFAACGGLRPVATGRRRCRQAEHNASRSKEPTTDGSDPKKPRDPIGRRGSSLSMNLVRQRPSIHTGPPHHLRDLVDREGVGLSDPGPDRELVRQLVGDSRRIPRDRDRSDPGHQRNRNAQ
jgi:hypothetical protein